MAKRTWLGRLLVDARNADELCRTFTGKSILQHGKTIFGLVEEDVRNAMKADVEGDNIPINSPYAVLHARPSYSDALLKYRFRALVKELHPDTGIHPDPEEYQRVVEAYQVITQERIRVSSHNNAT